MKIFKDVYLIFLWITLALFVICSDGVSAEFNSLSNSIQILLTVIIILLSISLFISFYASIRKKNIKYFSRTLITFLILILSLITLNSKVGNSITNIIRGNPQTIAVFRGVQLILRDNNKFDIWYPLSFPLISFKKVFAGNYITDNEEIIFLYDNDIPNYFSSIAKYESDNLNRDVIRFILPNNNRFDYYVIN